MESFYNWDDGNFVSNGNHTANSGKDAVAKINGIKLMISVVPNEYICQNNILALFNHYFFKKYFSNQCFAKIFANHLDK